MVVQFEVLMTRAADLSSLGGQAYIDMGIEWCKARWRGLASRILVSSGEKMYAGGEDVIAQVESEAR